jgi:hypothetical protein
MRVALFCSLLLLLPTAGCASDRDAIDKRMAGLRDDITRLQAENDHLGERVDALEVKGPAPAKAAATPAEPKVERAPLKVVKLVPGEGPAPSGDAEAPELAADERPDAPGTRPVIRLRGKGEDGPTRSSSKRQNAGEDPQ